MAGIERKSNFRDGLSLTGGETWVEYHSTELWVARRQGCCCSVAKLYPTLCDPMDGRFAQTYVHWVGIQPPHPQLPPSPPALNLSQQQSLFQWVSSSHQVATVLGASTSVLPMSIQGWFPLGLAGLTPNPIWLILILWDRNGVKMTVLNHALKQLMEAGLPGPYRLKPKSFPSA